MPLVLAMAAVGIAAILLVTPRHVPWSRASRALARILPSGRRHRARPAITMTEGARAWKPDEPKRRTTNDAQDLDRMNDDGGSQMSRPPAL